jgi:hypothetical protein
MSHPASVYELLELLRSCGGRIPDREVPEHLRNALAICRGGGAPLIVRRPWAGTLLGNPPPLVWKLTTEGEAALALHREVIDSPTVLRAQGDEGEPKQDHGKGKEIPAAAKEKRPRMTVEEANREAMELVKQLGQAFFALSENEQARRIGCAWKTWSKTEFFKAARKKREQAGRQRGPGKATGAPPVVSFTSALEVVTGDGEREAVLEKLIAEQEADNEPSPLEDDSPSDRPRKVFTRNRRL